MTTHRRAFIASAAAAAALTPAAAHAQWPFGWGRRRSKAPVEGRGVYAGGFRQQLGDWQFDLIRAAVSTRLQPVIRDGLEARLTRSVEAMPQAQAVTAALAEPNGAVWTHGWTREPGAAPVRFAWPDVAASYTATAILQMVEAGQLSLDGTLERWAPDQPNAAWITIEDLLAHTSGLPAETPAEGATAAARFAPGSAWGYSPADYALLAEIIAAVDGRPWQEALAVRVAERRDLSETVFLPQREVEASSLDVVRFWRDLLGDRLHGPQITRQRFARLYAMPGAEARYHGLGVMAADLAVGEPAGASVAGDTWLGYFGAQGLVAHSMRTRATVAVALTGDGSAELIARALLADLREA